MLILISLSFCDKNIHNYRIIKVNLFIYFVATMCLFFIIVFKYEHICIDITHMNYIIKI